MPSSKPAITIRCTDAQYQRVIAAADKQMRSPSNFVAMAVQTVLQVGAPVETSDRPLEVSPLTIAEADERYGQLVCTGRGDHIGKEQIEALCGKNGLLGWQPPAMRPEWEAARKAYLAVKWAPKPEQIEGESVDDGERE